MATKIIGSGLGESAKALSVDQFFQYLERISDEPTISKVYAAVAWANRCIQLRCNALASIPYAIFKGETEVTAYEDIPFEDMFWDLEADLCHFGAGFWLRDKPRTATAMLDRLNPQTVRVKTSPQGIVSFVQDIEGQDPKIIKPEQMVYFRYYDPDDDLGPGVSPMQVAHEAADLGRNANVWASQFFSHGAIPAVVLSTEMMLPDQELERVKNAWERLTRGVRRAWRTIVLRQGLKPEVIQPPIGELAMTELYAQVRAQIAVAFGVPETMLADAANYATAREHRLGFYQDTVIPEALQIQSTLNQQMFRELGLRFEFVVNEIEAVQKDEADKAGYLAVLVQSKIITKDEAREQLGFEPMTTDQEEELKPPQPDFTPRNNGNQPGPPRPPNNPEDAGRPYPQRSAAAVAMEADLDKWQRKALAKGADAPFESEFIPPDTMAAIRAALGGATTDEEVRAAFAAGFWQAYP